jgi:DNA repair/transcription protein MET18/MMS19
VACYFPINFTPPQNDTIKVNPSTLKQMLSDCFTASPKLVGHFVPFLLDKLSAKQVETKLETLDLLSVFAQKFSS